jgi:hypothetical protein
MAITPQKLAESLAQLHRLQEKDKVVILQGTTQISRTYLKRLLDSYK